MEEDTGLSLLLPSLTRGQEDGVMSAVVSAANIVYSYLY